MTEQQLLIQINYYCKRLGSISTLAFRKLELQDILDELVRLDAICIVEAE